MLRAIRNNALFVLVCAVFILATAAFVTHNLYLNQQYDTQVIRYAIEWIESAYTNRFWEWMTELPARKYPLLYIAPFTLSFHLLSQFFPAEVPMEHTHLLARIVTLFYSVGTVFFLVRTARFLNLRTDRVLLLLFSSVLFFLFITAVRPHGAVTFWTLAAYYYALRLDNDGSTQSKILSLASAAIAFATLQSGLFAFIFPLWAGLRQDRTWKSRIAIVWWCAFYIGLGAIIGYPFLLQGLLQTANGVVDTSLGHDIPFQFQPWIMPAKLWMLVKTENILMLSGLIGMVVLQRKRNETHSEFVPVYWYLVLFYCIFLMQTITSTRFFLPTFPFLALLGSFAFSVLPNITQALLSLLLIGVYTQLSLLGFRWGTMEEASIYLSNKPGYISSNLPSYFFLLPSERFTSAATQSAASFAVLTTGDGPAGMHLCARFASSPLAERFAENQSPFLWNAVEWPLYAVFRTRALGPNVQIYCKESKYPSLSSP